MLGDVETDRDGRRVAVADFKIDVAHGGVKSSGIGVSDGGVRRHAARRRKGNAVALTASLARPRAREHHHDALALLKSWRIVREQEDGPRCPEAKDTDAGPDIDGARQPVAARRHEYYSLARMVLSLVYSGLKRSARIALSVGGRSKFWRIQVNRSGVIEPRGDDRLARSSGSEAEQY